MSRTAEALLPSAFGGSTYDPQRDGARLSRQLTQVRNLMLDGRKRSLGEIRTATGINSDASVSARLRDLRKDKFGGYDLRKENTGGGTWVYWVQL